MIIFIKSKYFDGHSVISPSSLHDCDSNESTYFNLLGID